VARDAAALVRSPIDRLLRRSEMVPTLIAGVKNIFDMAMK
jgi:hypothetical protein